MAVEFWFLLLKEEEEDWSIWLLSIAELFTL